MNALLVHGAGGGAWEWNAWRPLLSASGIRAHALDLQAIAAGLARTTLADYRGQVARAVHALPRPRVLVGASLGGLLAAMCADDADALVLVNPLPPAPWAGQLPARSWPEVVPWQSQARLASTCRAMTGADPASTLFAFRHWRDESGAVLGQAHAGVALPAPHCPVLVMVSAQDADVPPALPLAMAEAWHASVMRLPARSHVGPLLGRDAVPAARQAVAWMNGLGLQG